MNQLIGEILIIVSSCLYEFKVCFYFLGGVCRFFNLPNGYADQYSVEKYHLYKVLDTLVESGLIAERFDVEIKFLLIINNFAIEVNLEAMRCLATLSNKTMHELKTMRENALQDVIKRSRNYLEGDQ